MSENTPEQLFVENSADSAANIAIFGIGALVVLAIMIIAIVAVWKLFAKAGEPGWKALIPIYNNWVFLRLGNQAGWWALVGLIPFVGIISYVFTAIAAYNIGLKLQKEGWWVILYILVPGIWFLILAFDKSRWADDTTGIVPSPVTGGHESAPAYVPPETTTDTDSAEEPATKPPLQL